MTYGGGTANPIVEALAVASTVCSSKLSFAAAVKPQRPQFQAAKSAIKRTALGDLIEAAFVIKGEPFCLPNAQAGEFAEATSADAENCPAGLTPIAPSTHPRSSESLTFLSRTN